MRSVCLSSLLFVALTACGTTQPEESPFLEPNQLMGQEIQDRIEQIPYQHREELFNNLLWLAQSGEQSIPALLRGLGHSDPKVRSNCAWVLAQTGDRRVIPELQVAANDTNETVRLEVARSLVTLGDLDYAPWLIEGLDSDKVQVRYLCHEALKSATRRDFDYDHLADDELSRAQAVYRWRQWWAKQSGDQYFATGYAERHGLQADGQPMVTQPGTPAAPAGETAPRMQPAVQPMPQIQTTTDGQTDTGVTTAGQDSPTTEPMTEPTTEPMTEPTTEPMTEPMTEPTSDTPVPPQPQR